MDGNSLVESHQRIDKPDDPAEIYTYTIEDGRLLQVRRLYKFRESSSCINSGDEKWKCIVQEILQEEELDYVYIYLFIFIDQ